MLIRSGLAALTFSVFSSLALANPPASLSQKEESAIDRQLKQEVIEAEKRLNVLEPWQKAIFSEEVIPQFQRFIKDYKASSQGIRVEVDLDTLKRYLLFYAPKFFKARDPKLVVVLESPGSCAKCQEQIPGMQQLVKSRLANRGFVPVWISPEELGPHSDFRAVEAKSASIARSKGAVGILFVSWGPAPVDDLDTAHADEVRYLAQAHLKIGDLSPQSRQKDLLDPETFQPTEARLLTDLFTDLGARVEIQESTLAEKGKEEVYIEVVGIKDFAQYNRVKTALQNQLQGLSPLEDRKFAKGRVTFSVYAKFSADEVRKQLAGLNLAAGGDHGLTVVVK